MIQAARGSFSLSFAVCNDAKLRDYLIERVRSFHSAVETVSIPPHTVDVFGHVQKAAADAKRAALFVLNLEHSLDSTASDHPSLRSLNASRELWERHFSCSVVFWVAEFAAALVSMHARDFWRYRSHRFEFVSEHASPLAAVSDRFGQDLALVDSLSADERHFRIAELESRLTQAGEHPPPELAPHVRLWTDELAYLYYSLARYADAELLLRRALKIDEASYGPDHPNVARDLNNLAMLLRSTNRLAEAELLMRRVIAIFEKSYGPTHPNVATALNNLAQSLQATNRLSEAEPLMRRALKIDEAFYGPDYPNVAIDLNNLAMLLRATNRLGEAEPLFRRALKILEQSHGPDHPDVATDLNNLALLFQATNRLSEAEPLMRRALTIDEASYGPDHPNVARDLNNLATLLQATNRLPEVEPLMRRALTIDEASYGPDHPKVATRLNNLATLLQATNRLAEAEPLMRLAVEIYRDFQRATGHEHPHFQTVFGNYLALLQAMKLSETETAARLRDLTP